MAKKAENVGVFTFTMKVDLDELTVDDFIEGIRGEVGTLEGYGRDSKATLKIPAVPAREIEI